MTVWFVVERLVGFMLVVSVVGLFVICVMWKLWTCASTARRPGS